MAANHRVGRSQSSTASTALVRGRRQHEQHHHILARLFGIWLTVSMVAGAGVLVSGRESEPTTGHDAPGAVDPVGCT